MDSLSEMEKSIESQAVTKLSDTQWIVYGYERAVKWIRELSVDKIREIEGKTPTESLGREFVSRDGSRQITWRGKVIYSMEWKGAYYLITEHKN